MITIFYRVATLDNTVLIIKAEEHYNGLFGQKTEWEIYYKPESSWGSTFTHLSKTTDRNKIAEIIRINFGVKSIEII